MQLIMPESAMCCACALPASSSSSRRSLLRRQNELCSPRARPPLLCVPVRRLRRPNWSCQRQFELISHRFGFAPGQQLPGPGFGSEKGDERTKQLPPPRKSRNSKRRRSSFRDDEDEDDGMNMRISYLSSTQKNLTVQCTVAGLKV